MSPEQRPKGNPRRLVLVDTGFGLWGGQRYAMRLIEFLGSSDFDVVIATQAGSALGEWWDSNGGKVFNLPGKIKQERGRKADIRNFGLVIRHTIALRQFVKSTKPDVLLGNSSASHPTVAIVGATTGIASILILHEEKSPPIIRDAAIRLATQTIAVSARVKESVARYARPKTSVVHNGVDTELFRPGASDPETRRLLTTIPEGVIVGCIGRIDPAKQVEDVIQAVYALPRDMAEIVSLVCIGSTSHSPEYEDKVLVLGNSLLKSRFRHFAVRDDVELLLQNVDIAVFAGRSEGMSLGMLEAMSAGCAVVAYAAAGVEEVIVDGVSGLVVPMGDERELISAIKSLVASPESRSRMGAAAQERVRVGFDLKARAEDVIEIIQGVL